MKTCSWTCSVTTLTACETLTLTLGHDWKHWECSVLHDPMLTKAVLFSVQQYVLWGLIFAVAVVHSVYRVLFVCQSSKHITGSSEALCASYYLAGAIYCSMAPVSKGSNQSYAADLSFMENVGVKLVACWTTGHRYLRKAFIVIILMFTGSECWKQQSRENCSSKLLLHLYSISWIDCGQSITRKHLGTGTSSTRWLLPLQCY